MNSRDIKEVQKDCKKIKRVAYSTSATSIAEIAKKLEFPEARVISSLEQFPKLEYKIKKLLSKKRNEFLERQAKKEAKIQVKLKCSESMQIEEKTNLPVYVWDASFTGVKFFGEKLREIVNSNSKIVLTSVTIRELDKLQKLCDSQAVDARYILAVAAENNEKFENVLIDEAFPSPDDSIINYCVCNKDSVILLTCDKVMALKARMYGVNTEYYRKDLRKNGYVNHKKKLVTLEVAKRQNGKLVISKFNDHNCGIKVISNNRDYTEGVVNLKENDEIYVVTKKTGYITFAHYVLVSLQERDNAILKFSIRIHNDKQIKKLPEVDYRRFVHEFKIRRDL